MDSFEWNKVAGGVLAAFLIIMGVNTLAGGLFSKHRPEKPAYDLCANFTCEASGAGAAEAVTAVAYDLGTELVSADAAKGETVFKKCATCHTVEKGGANKTGPNLWGILNSNHAHKADFAYSDAFKAKAGEPWTIEAMDKYLEHPNQQMKGTKMAFAGLANPQDRANVIAYLNKNADAPVAYPAPKAVAVPAAAAPATAAAAPAGPDFKTLLVSATPDKGAQVFKKCATCHTVEKGGANKTGPNLWGILNSNHAHKADFAYSDAFKAKAGEPWSVDGLNAYLEHPNVQMKGTKMAFAGLSKPEERAAVIAYLNANSDKPLPLK